MKTIEDIRKEIMEMTVGKTRDRQIDIAIRILQREFWSTSENIRFLQSMLTDMEKLRDDISAEWRMWIKKGKEVCGDEYNFPKYKRLGGGKGNESKM